MTATTTPTIEDVPLVDCGQCPKPGKISPERMEQLKRSLKADREMLRACPLIALPDRTVVCGNQRLRAAMELGRETIPNRACGPRRAAGPGNGCCGIATRSATQDVFIVEARQERYGDKTAWSVALRRQEPVSRTKSARLRPCVPRWQPTRFAHRDHCCQVRPEAGEGPTGRIEGTEAVS
jgi:hypothetical protein